MSRTITTLTLLLLVGVSTTANAATQNHTTTRSQTSGVPSAAEVHAGVLTALHANHELAVRALWTNHVPAAASESTRGPALAAMRVSAQGRENEHLRVRMMHDSYRIISIRLDPSYASATAVVQSNQKLVPSQLDGRRLGRPVELNERARIELHRIGSSSRFIVWRLTLQK
jgi:hypothetical protein